MMRLVNALVIAALIISATWVYKIKFDSTLDTERVSKLRAEIRRERDTVASLRAEWAKLNRPERIQPLAQKHLTLRPVETAQYDPLDKLPERPRQLVPPGTTDPIGAIIEIFADSEALTGTLVDPGRR
jgi:cell division protein FtsL